MNTRGVEQYRDEVLTVTPYLKRDQRLRTTWARTGCLGGRVAFVATIFHRLSPLFWQLSNSGHFLCGYVDMENCFIRMCTCAMKES